MVVKRKIGKKKLRIVDGTRTLTTRYRFKKRFPTSVYNRSSKQYEIKSLEQFKIIKSSRKKRQKKEKVFKKQHQVPIKRMRRQVVLNMRSSQEPYAASIRAITINPEITNTGLKLAIIETLREVQIDINEFETKTFGYEYVEIPPSEDKRLNDYRVHVEVLIKRNKPINFIK